MRTLLFGGSGFMGEYFMRRYPQIISAGRACPCVNNVYHARHINVPTLDALYLLDNVEFDAVIFLIGNSNHHAINTSGMMGIEYNVLPLKKALQYLAERKLKKFVCFTTILLYGSQPNDHPVNESAPIFPYQNDYIFSKYLAEQVAEFYKSRVPVINVRLSNIYGATKLVRPDLVPTLITDVLTKEHPSVWNMAPQRDFIYVADAVDAVMKLLETDYTGTVNLGSGRMTSVREIVTVIEKLSGKKVTDLNKPVTGTPRFCTDISLVKALTRWEPRYTLEEGLRLTFEEMSNEMSNQVSSIKSSRE